MRKFAEKYQAQGLSIIPINDNKRPIGRWKIDQSEITEIDSRFDDCFGIGIVCGKVSGNLEVIDVDLKYDITGKLWDKLQANISSNLMNKLVIQGTKNNGYHLIYRCDTINGNTKLANRLAIDGENGNPVLIETRGEGGYIVVAPTEGYHFVQKHLNEIPLITETERKELLSASVGFNEIEKVEYQTESCFEDYNNRGDTLGLLQSHGWTIIQDDGDKAFLKRPGESDSEWSADYTRSKGLFYVWTSSTDFASEKAYNNVAVFTLLECHNDWKESAKRLKEMGYGTTETIIKKVKTDFLADKKEIDDYLTSVIDGTFKRGLLTGHDRLDEYFRYKRGNFVVWNGHDNVGKSVFCWYLISISAKKHDWNWIIYAGENKVGTVYLRLMEFYIGVPISSMADDDIKKAKTFVDSHFSIINNEEMYSYRDMIDIATSLLKRKEYHGFFIDPYNSLDIKMGDTKLNTHEYHYKATSEFRLFCRNNNITIWLSAHAISEALRRLDPDGHPQAPHKADTEGGGKFSNRADDFVTLHRKVQCSEKYRIMEVHVRKIKEVETGGRPTPKDSPVKLTMESNNCGYYNEDIEDEDDKEQIPF